MEIRITNYKRCDVIKIIGRVDSSTAPILEQNIKNLMEAGHYHIILDLSEMEFISSAGLRVLISAQKNCRRYNRGEVVLAAVPTNILKALDLAGFTSLFHLQTAVVTAVANF
jgi:anti-sigma B factor antagonist